MYRFKILIADDESVIRNNLSDLIVSSVPSIEKLVLCSDGKQVIDILKKQNIDIIVSDIRMPILSGLDIANYVQKHNLYTKIIFISGFSEFEYAHKAIQYGVTNFILKPIDFNEIISAINDNIKSLSENMNQIRNKALTEIHMHEVIRRYLSLYLFGVIPFSKLSELNSTSLLLKTFVRCAIVEIHIDNTNAEDLINSYYNTMWVDICEISNNKFDSYCISESEDSAKLLVMISESDFINAKNEIKLYLEDCKRMMKGAYQKDFVYDIKFYDSLENISLMNLSELANIFINHLIHFNNTGNQDMLKILMISLPIGSVHNFLYNVLTILKNNYAFLSQDLEKRIPSIKDLQDIISFTEELSLEFHSSTSTNYIVNKVIKYIHTHFGDKELDLNFIANKFNFNRSYLSRVFKQQTGQNPSEYIFNTRMEESKELLKSNKYSIKQIAGKVGYTDEGYFGQAFKKTTGVTPSRFMRNMEE